MKTVGIICECNPFHEGHEYLIREARKAGADVVVALMSGCFVQRGEAAIAEPHMRAEALICGDADVVLELPFPFSAAGAEAFARAGVSILDRLQIDELWFGSESGELSRLTHLAEICESEDFARQYAATVGENKGTAQAFFELLSTFSGQDVKLLSNDILGISYLRAIHVLKAKLRPHTVKREGSAYLEGRLNQDGIPSATALRRRWREAGVESILPYLPTKVAPIYARAGAPADLRHAESLILGFLRLASLGQLDSIAELSGGLGARLSQNAAIATGYDELLSLSATKKYPISRLCRGILFALTGVSKSDLRSTVSYVRLLAANSTGCAFLSTCRKESDLPIVTRHTDLPSSPEALRQTQLAENAWSLYTLCQAQTERSDGLWRQAPTIL